MLDLREDIALLIDSGAQPLDIERIVRRGRRQRKLRRATAAAIGVAALVVSAVVVTTMRDEPTSHVRRRGELARRPQAAHDRGRRSSTAIAQSRHRSASKLTGTFSTSPPCSVAGSQSTMPASDTGSVLTVSSIPRGSS